jgi:hypothetical protein
LSLFHFYPILFSFHLFVLAEMLDVFRVYQILHLGVLIVILLEVVDLVFILVITVVSRTETGVWQLLAGSAQLYERLS